MAKTSGKKVLKDRRLILVLEADTNMPMEDLLDTDEIEMFGLGEFMGLLKVIQIQANVIKPEKKK